MLFWLHWMVPSFAQDGDDPGDDIDIEESDDETANPQRPVPPPVDEPDQPIGDEDADDTSLDTFKDDAEEDTDLLGDEEQKTVGSDTEQIYRRFLAELSELQADEQLAGWEEYLAKYPDTAYRKRIETRMEELSDEMYADRIDGGDGRVDALDQEIDFSHGLQLENINPRTRVQAGFEFGIPNYFNLFADYEQGITRNFSAHGGLKRRYLGYSIEAGVRWAPVKSVRTGTILSLIGDFRLNTNPLYPSFRPQVAFGKRAGPVDFQIQGGAELAYRPELNTIQPTIVGGASLFFRVNEGVGTFLETSSYMRPAAEELPAFAGGLFRFNVVSFGFKFYPSKKGDIEVNTGGTVPYIQQWWQFHYGSVMGQFNWYPES